MLFGSLTALNSSVVLPVKNSRGVAPSRWLSLKVIGHVDGPLLSPICLFPTSGMSAIVLHAHFQKLGPGEWPKLPEQDTPPLSASHSSRATQGTSIESLIDRILRVPEILLPDECPKDLEISETVIGRWVQQLADPNLDRAELDSQCELRIHLTRARLALTCHPTSLWVGMAFLGKRKIWRQWKPCRCLLSKLKHRLPF